ncbi:DUF5715 family protein [Rhodococcus erythropolis]|uniref:DUF5715 family protein n=1 Tax=Rhodococcus erythropolis TaxID=1833 RepID=UPI002948DABE|nr:DUF5715 family protein [Rhodococcus erythropolis]MDV6278352.1 DUF5715 family protein [Rhodococcus erythropolis]
MKTIDPGSGSGCNPDPLTDPHVVQRYRDEITDLSAGFATDPADAVRVVRTALTSSIVESVLQRAPRGQRFAEEQLLHSIRSFSPTAASSANDLRSLVRIHLLSALDAAWWSDAIPFATDDEVRDSAELVDLRVLRRGREINFGFRVQAHDLPRRVMRAAVRRAAPRLTPATIGMKLPYGRPEVVALLNACALELAARSPARSPRLWVNSMARSTAYQNELRTFGYLAAASSAHCVGWAADVEMDWMRRRGMGALLEEILCRRAEEGQINLIDEGRAWHVCVNPRFVPTLRAMWRAQTGTV